MVHCLFGKCDSVLPTLLCKSRIDELFCIVTVLVEFRAEELIAQWYDSHDEKFYREILTRFFCHILLSENFPVFITAPLDNHSFTGELKTGDMIH